MSNLSRGGNGVELELVPIRLQWVIKTPYQVLFLLVVAVFAVIILINAD